MAANTEEVEESLPTHAYPCPTCGMLFSESDMCDTHAAFCSQSDEPAGDWTEERIHLLIDCMDARYGKFVQMSPKERKHHWKRTAHIVGATADETRHRWNQLTASYNRIRIAKAQGRGRMVDRWQYFEKMDNILGDRVTTRPEFVISSMPLEASADGSVQPVSGMLVSPESEVEAGGTPQLIDLMEQRYPKYIKMTAKKRKAFWREIAEELGTSPDEARIRWNMLVGSYKRTKFNRAQKRSGRGPKHKWRYFEQMERIVGDRYKPVMPLLVLSSRPLHAAPAISLNTGSNLFTAGTATATTLPDIAPAPPAGAASTPAAPATVLQFGPNGLLQAVPQASLQPPPAGVQPPPAGVQATVLQAGTPQQQQADIEAFSTKRKALFVEDYLRAKARREEQRLQLEERRIRALERLVDVMEARGNC